jgi:hypothetical protein
MDGGAGREKAAYNPPLQQPKPTAEGGIRPDINGLQMLGWQDFSLFS